MRSVSIIVHFTKAFLNQLSSDIQAFAYDTITTKIAACVISQFVQKNALGLEKFCLKTSCTGYLNIPFDFVKNFIFSLY